jgi:hypothetical protein
MKSKEVSMARKNTHNRPARPSPEEERTMEAVPGKENPRSLLVPFLFFCAALVMLGIGAHALITGKTLLIEEKGGEIPAVWIEFLGSVLISVWCVSHALGEYSPGLKTRVGAFLAAPLYLCAGTALLAYDVYGLVTNSLRLLFLGRFSSSGGIFLSGPPAWVLFLAYLSFSTGMIAMAVEYWIRGDNAALHAKIDKVGEKALVLALILYLGAALLAGRLNLHH